MKLLCLLLLALQICAIASAQTGNEPTYFGTRTNNGPVNLLATSPSASQPRNDAPSALRKVLPESVWSWQRPQDREATPIRFTSNGMARTLFWTATFTVQSPLEVELQLDGRTAKLTFNSSYSHFQGNDFDNSAVQGSPATVSVVPVPNQTSAAKVPSTRNVPAPSAIPTPARRIATEENLGAFLGGTVWQWGGRSPQPETIAFFANGTATVFPSGWSAKVVVKTSREIQLQTSWGVAKMAFDPTYTTYEGFDFDGKWPLQGDRLK